MHCSLFRWSVKCLTGVKNDRTLVQGCNRSSSWLLQILQHLTEPTCLTLNFDEADEMSMSADNRCQEMDIQERILDELRINFHVTEITFIGFRDIHVIDQILVANQSITKLKICLLEYEKRSVNGLDFDAIRCLLKRGPRIELSFSHIFHDNTWFCSLVDAIRDNATLTSLSMSCAYTNDGNWLQKLCRAIRTCFVLSELNLRNIYIGNHVHNFGDMLTKNLTITELNLDQNYISPLLKPISDALVKNSTLKKLGLKRKSITDNTGVLIADVLRVNSTLLELDLIGNQISLPFIFDALQQNTTLKILKIEITGTAIGLETSLAEMIQHNSTVSELSLNIDFTLGDKLVQALSVSRSLHVLDLSFSKLSFMCVEALGQALVSNRSLVELKMSVVNARDQDSHLFPTFCEGLKANCTLKFLWYTETSELGEHQANGMIAIANALAINTGLEEVSLQTAGMTSEHVKILAFGLKGNKTLKRLVLTDFGQDHLFNNNAGRRLAREPIHDTSLRSSIVNALKADRANCFADALKINTSLEDLTINSVHPSEGSEVVIDALVNALKVNKSIQFMGLHHGLIDDQRLMEAYRVNPALTCQFYSAMSESRFLFYSRLNRTGRCLWTDSNFPATLWSRALVLANARSSPEGPDLLFHCILERPDIFKNCY